MFKVIAEFITIALLLIGLPVMIYFYGVAFGLAY